MTREEAIKQLKSLLAYCERMGSKDDSIFESDCEALKIALSALRPVTREQVEKVWRGEWVVGEPNGLGFPIHCSRCGWGSDHADQCEWLEYKGHIFCGHCGAPMTDKAVELVLKRLEALYEG